MLIRYYFDIHDGSDLYPDEEGMDLPNQIAAGVEAAQSLADMAKDTLQFDRRRAMALKSGQVRVRFFGPHSSLEVLPRSPRWCGHLSHP